MKKRPILRLVPIVLVYVIAFLAIGCFVFEEPGQTQSETPIFSDVEKIVINQNGNPMNEATGLFFYELPREVKFAIVEFFPQNSIVIDDSDKTVSTANLVGGSRTGLEAFGFDRGVLPANRILQVKADKSDFASPPYLGQVLSVSVAYSWIVLGYDDNLNLTHASPARTVTINW